MLRHRRKRPVPRRLFPPRRPAPPRRWHPVRYRLLSKTENARDSHAIRAFVCARQHSGTRTPTPPPPPLPLDYRAATRRNGNTAPARARRPRRYFTPIHAAVVRAIKIRDGRRLTRDTMADERERATRMRAPNIISFITLPHARILKIIIIISS